MLVGPEMSMTGRGDLGVTCVRREDSLHGHTVYPQADESTGRPKVSILHTMTDRRWEIRHTHTHTYTLHDKYYFCSKFVRVCVCLFLQMPHF